MVLLTTLITPALLDVGLGTKRDVPGLKRNLMAGKRGYMVLGNWNQHGTHVPVSMAVSQRKKLDPEGWLWNSVLATNGQPRHLV